MNAPDLISLIERIAPPHGAASWDKSGIQVAGRQTRISSVAVALDPTPDTVERAIVHGANFILTHHPLSLTPRFLDTVDDHFRTVSTLIESGVCLYSAHTSLDVNPRGPVSWLADELGLRDRQVLEEVYRPKLTSFAFSASDAVTPDRWRNLMGVLSVTLREGMICITCREDVFPHVRESIASTLGYVPLFLQHLPIHDNSRQDATDAERDCPTQVLGYGCLGTLPHPMSPDHFFAMLANVVEREYWVTSGPVPGVVSTVGYCTGSGSGLADTAFRKGADVFITGDVKYHTALDALGCLIDVGHFSLEEEMMRRMAMLLADALPDISVFFLPAQDPMRLVLRDGH